jgi:branched-chain amino acid transport system substrate-binding protein
MYQVKRREAKMKKVLMAGLVLCLVALLVLPMGLGCAGPKAKVPTIKVGVIGPMTDIQGRNHWQGATMAMNEINEAGGIKVGEAKMPIELIKANSNENVSVPDSVTAMEKVIIQDGADFVVGGNRTESVLAMQDVAMDNKTIFLNCGSGGVEVCSRVAKNYDRYKYTFRVSTLNSNYLSQVLVLVLKSVSNQVKAQLGTDKLKVALLMDKLDWAEPIVTAAPPIIKGLGMEVAGVWRPSATASNLSAELTAIKGSGANIILTGLAGASGIVYAKQWEELEIPACSVGINIEAQSTSFWAATGGKGNYETTLNTIAPVAITSKTLPFIEKYQKQWGEFPPCYASTYDALYVLKEAIERAGTLDADTIVAELEKTKYEGVCGTIAFYPLDNPAPHDLVFGPGYVTAVAIQWHDGKMTCVWPDGDWQGVKYPGTVEYVVPPWVIKK